MQRLGPDSRSPQPLAAAAPRSRAGETLRFGTKAETLERVSHVLRSGRVLPLAYFSVRRWCEAPERVLAELLAHPWSALPLIVRSSASAEDAAGRSLAGAYLSVAEVRGEPSLRRAIAAVIDSYGETAAPGDQVLVQPMCAPQSLGGVAFSRDPNTGGHYWVINYSARGGACEVTSGADAPTRCYYCDRSSSPAQDGAPLAPVLAALSELEEHFGGAPLDVEFALGLDGVLSVLQVRALLLPRASALSAARQRATLDAIAQKLRALSRRHPELHGERSVFGVMPDWNPAEIIGIRPRPLALSLYKELITDSIWAYQRDNYGYRALRSFPLMTSLFGLPYIDVRVSFNSFVPKDLPGALAERLVGFYLDSLCSNPAHHDKVEFEILLSCYTLDLPQRCARLREHGFSDSECSEVASSLRRLTNRIIGKGHELWRRDLERIDVLEERRSRIAESDLDRLGKIYWLLEDCKRYGTLPFAGLARAAFIAVQMLDSLCAVGLLSTEERSAFLASLHTVSGEFARDWAELPREVFLAAYGHLRPGSYDILSPRYDEAPERYFGRPGTALALRRPGREFAVSLAQLCALRRALEDHAIDLDPLSLLEFIKLAIEGRERSKFLFTRNLSDALQQICALGAEHGLSPEQMSFVDVAVLKRLHIDSEDVAAALRASAAEGEHRYSITRSLCLPSLITDPEQVFRFHVPPSQPSFITQERVVGPVAAPDTPGAALADCIVALPSADPGYDWLFSRGIKGLLTQYGGVNSHMAIRAAELGIAAVIGAGEERFSRWSAARVLAIDCAARQVQVIQ
jgi:hypothetical protein